jgi:hypothetical protein
MDILLIVDLFDALGPWGVALGFVLYWLYKQRRNGGITLSGGSNNGTLLDIVKALTRIEAFQKAQGEKLDHIIGKLER